MHAPGDRLFAKHQPVVGSRRAFLGCAANAKGGIADPFQPRQWDPVTIRVVRVNRGNFA
jgi:hypothetical protein